MDEKSMAAGIAGLVKGFVDKAMKALSDRLDELERQIAGIPAGRDGRDGQKGDPGDRGTNGRDGVNGKDGLGIDDLTAEHDGERGIVFRFANGDRVKEFRFEIPAVLDKGYWKDGTEARKGDGMTFGGSYWIAQTETKSKPDIGNPDWRLAVKKGRDGKDGERGEKGDPGKVITK